MKLIKRKTATFEKGAASSANTLTSKSLAQEDLHASPINHPLSKNKFTPTILEMRYQIKTLMLN